MRISRPMSTPFGFGLATATDDRHAGRLSGYRKRRCLPRNAENVGASGGSSPNTSARYFSASGPSHSMSMIPDRGPITTPML